MPTTTNDVCNVSGPHCETCGTTDYEDLFGPDTDDGYTACCNEPVVYQGECRAANRTHGTNEIDWEDEKRKAILRRLAQKNWHTTN